MPITIDTWLVIIGGFFAAVISIPLILRWLRLVLGLFGIRTGEPLNQPPKRRPWLLPLLLLHPSCWIFAALAYFTIKALLGGVTTNWEWFLGGFYSGFLFFAALVFALYRRRLRANTRVGT